MIERLLIEHCSPTLAGIKTAGMFNCPIYSEYELRENLRKLNAGLNSKDVYIDVLRISSAGALIFAYRKQMLESALKNSDVTAFLISCGYENNSVLYCIEYLKNRIARASEFPHEIGVFLGYPLQDVTGFIKNGGKNSRCTGLWKVYCNEEQATFLFRQYKECKKIYMKHYSQGRSISQLTNSCLI